MVMNHIFPHPPYAEDQPFARTILVAHCLHRGLALGALGGAAVPVALVPVRLLRRAVAADSAPIHPSTSVPTPGPTRTATATATASAAAGRPRAPLLTGGMVVRSAGVGAVVGVGAIGAAVAAKMWGEEEYAWQDRSWRILENGGQNYTDMGGIVGAAAGAGWAAASRGNLGGWRGAVGRVALGNAVALTGSMVYTMSNKQ